jgi:hypothetical protein
MRTAAKLLLLGSLLLPGLTACQPTRSEMPAVTEPPSSAAESSRKYGPVIAEVRRALEEKLPDIAWRAAEPAHLSPQPDGECILSLPSYDSDGDIVEASDEFRKVMDAINPVLDPNGFSTVSVLDEGSKGWWAVTSGNSQGAQVGINGRYSVMLTLDVPVNSHSCSDDELVVLEG